MPTSWATTLQGKKSMQYQWIIFCVKKMAKIAQKTQKGSIIEAGSVGHNKTKI